MFQIMLEKLSQGTDVTISADNYQDARRAYQNILRASIKLDKCTKTIRQGTTSNGWYSFQIRVPGLPYVVACERIAKLWPDAETTRYPHPLIGG